jgi:hypothetical protein
MYMQMYMDMYMFLFMLMFMPTGMYIHVDVHEHLLYVHLLCTCSLICSHSFMFMLMVTDKDIGIHTWLRFVQKIIEKETKRSSSLKNV